MLKGTAKKTVFATTALALCGAIGAKTLDIGADTMTDYVRSWVGGYLSDPQTIEIYVIKNDGSGAPLPGVVVTVKNLKSKESSSFTTDANGFVTFTIPRKDVIPFSASYDLDGFKYTFNAVEPIKTNPQIVTVANATWMRQPVGASTITLFTPAKSVHDKIEPPWLAVARGELGVKESPPPDSNPRIEDYHAATTFGRHSQREPWGCSFISWTLETAKTPNPPRTALCRDFMNYGDAIAEPRIGALAILDRAADPEATTGKVGLVLSWDAGSVTVIIGNVENQVIARRYATTLVRGYRWPAQPATAQAAP